MANSSTPRVVTVQLKQFRCFSERTFDLDAPLVYICGSNGSGKTSLIEALHYACYVRSFRTPSYRELSSHATDSFFIKLMVRSTTDMDQIQVGCYGSKRLIKVNQKRIEFHKDLIQHYRAITITEDSLKLVQEGPIERRAFLDTALALNDATYADALRLMQATLEARNAALHTGVWKPDLYTIWTQQLWERASGVQAYRILFLRKLEQEVRQLIATYFDGEFDIEFTYQPKRMITGATYDEFMGANTTLKNEELRFRRSLFGAHLDDINITFRHTKARSFASRGQQKLIVILIKAAYSKLLIPSEGPTVMLIDDFMTDFDHQRVTLLLQLLCDLDLQLIFTSPVRDPFFENLAKSACPSTLSLYLD
jgi:DNA replication and repair protein RecF